jgi:hypothetical protein
VVTTNPESASPAAKLTGSASKMSLVLQNQGYLGAPVRYPDRMQRVAVLA